MQKTKQVAIKSNSFNTTSRNPAELRQMLKDVLDKLPSTSQRKSFVLLLETDFTTSSSSVELWVMLLSEICSVLEPHQDILMVIFSKFDWWHSSDTLIRSYITLLVSILSAHPHLINPCLKGVVKNLCPPGAQPNQSEIVPPNTDQHVFEMVHLALKQIIKMLPSGVTVLHPVLKQLFPHHLRHDAEQHRAYLQNILSIIRYSAGSREAILETCVDKFIQLDVVIKLEDMPDEEEEDEDLVFEIEEDKLNVRSKTEREIPEMTMMAAKLDQLMLIMFTYIGEVWNTDSSAGQTTAIDDLFVLLMRQFDAKVLPTHKSKYTHFLLFYLASLRPETYPQQFLQYLLSKLFDSMSNMITRQSAAAYIGSYLSRANYLDVDTVKTALTSMAHFASQYLEKLPRNKATPDAALHTLFYTICQSLFYTICFYQDAFMGDGGREFLQQLDVERLIISALNPLKFCIPAVVNEFANLCSRVGMRTCGDVVNRNRMIALPTRSSVGTANSIDSFFPFDPYLLKASSSYISPIYRQWSSKADEQGTSA